VYFLNMITPKKILYFSLLLLVFASAVNVQADPPPGRTLTATSCDNPAVIKGMRIHPTDPLKMSFIIDAKDGALNPEDFQKMAMKQIRFFALMRV